MYPRVLVWVILALSSRARPIDIRRGRGGGVQIVVNLKLNLKFKLWYLTYFKLNNFIPAFVQI